MKFTSNICKNITDEIDSFLEQYSFGNVEKDSVAEVAEVDQLKQIDSFLLLTLKRIVVILKMSLKQGKLTKGRQYVESVYRDVRFQGERYMKSRMFEKLFTKSQFDYYIAVFWIGQLNPT